MRRLRHVPPRRAPPPNASDEARQRRADAPGGGFEPLRPGRPTTSGRSATATGTCEADEPGGEQPRPPGRRAEDVVRRRSDLPATSQSASSTANSGTKKEPSRKRKDWKLVSSSASAPTAPIAVVATMRSVCGACGEEVLQRHGARVRVGERLVGLRDGEHEEREQRDDPSRGHRRRKRGRVADLARQQDHGAEREEQGVGEEVADPRPPERPARRPREARVVGRERHPGDRHADDDVDRPARSDSPPAPGSFHASREAAAGQRPPVR